MQNTNFIVDIDSILNKVNNTESISEPLQESNQVQPITESAPETLLKIDEGAMDEVLAEWFYRLPKGYATHPYTDQELRVLDEVMQEYAAGKLNEELLKEATIADITNKALLDQVAAQNKQSEFEEFLSYIPGGIPTEQLLSFLNSLSKADATEFAKNLYTLKGVSDISPDQYASGVGKKLFEVKPEGMGKGEFFIAWLIPGARNSGGGESFDVRIGSQKYEVKDYRPDDSSGIRLGTKGKVTRFKFWYHIIDTIDYINAIHDIDPTFAILGAAGDQAKEIFKDGDFIKGGEFSMTIKALFNTFYENMNEDFKDTKTTGYTMITLRGANTTPVSYAIEELPKITGNKLTIKLTSDAMSPNENKILVLANRLKYVRDPESMATDLQEVVNKLVGSLPFIVFRKSQINITTDFRYKTISQGTIYILEASLADKEKTSRRSPKRRR